MANRTYRLTVEGELGDQMAWAFPGMTLTRGDGTTTVTGELRDQAELQGMLQRVSELGLTLLETKALGPRPDGRAARKPTNGEGPRRQPAAVPRPAPERS